MDSEEKLKKRIQTCGSCNCEDDEYSFSIAFETHAITVDGLSKKDLLEIKSCIDCMLMED